MPKRRRRLRAKKHQGSDDATSRCWRNQQLSIGGGLKLVRLRRAEGGNAQLHVIYRNLHSAGSISDGVMDT